MKTYQIITLAFATFVGGFFLKSFLYSAQLDDDTPLKGDTTWDMIENTDKDLKVVEGKYREALARAYRWYPENENSESSIAFDKSQKAWEAYRAAELDFLFSLGGSFAPVRVNIRDIDLLKERAEFLTIQTTEGEM